VCAVAVRILFSVLAAVAVAGCGSSESATKQKSAGAAGAPAEADTASNTRHTVEKSGFGTDGEYAWVAALVRNDSDRSGATVVVNFNLVDEAGQIITSGSQTESFSYPGEQLAIGTQVTLPEHAKPTRVDVTVNVEYPGIGPTTASQPLKFDTAQITKDEYGDYFHVAATVSNPTAETITTARVGILCYNAAGDIIGGNSAYPELIPPNGQTKIDTTVITTGEPASCDMRAPTSSGF
jgi:hypothetical protein